MYECEWCGRVYRPARADSTYCSERCELEDSEVESEKYDGWFGLEELSDDDYIFFSTSDEDEEDGDH